MKNKIKRNIVLNVLKTIVIAIFPLITYPYVLRVIGAENIGRVNYVASIVSYFSIVAALGVMNYAVRAGAPLRNEKEERNAFFNEVFTINSVTMTVSYIVLLIVCLCFSYLHSYYLLFIVQSLTFLFSWLGCEWVFAIYEDYLMITIRTFVSHILSLVALFVFVRTSDDYIIYSLINVLATGVSYLMNFIFLNKYYRPHLTLKPNFKKHFLPMLLLGANSLAIIVYVSADTTMIGSMMTDFDVGLYSTSVKIYSLLKQVMSAIIAVSTARMAFYFSTDKEKYKDLFNKMFKIIFICSVPVSVGLCMVSRDTVFLFAGQEYLGGAVSLRILSLAIPFASIGSLLATYGLIVQKKEKIVLAITVGSAVLNVGFNFLFIPWLGINGAAITTLISEVFVCIAFLVATKYYALIFKNLRTLFFAAAGSVLIFLTCFLSNRFIESLTIRLIVSISISVILYGLSLLLSRDEMIINELRKVFGKRKKESANID